MAKKKRKHRRPIAPPVHSAPETVHAPPRPVGPDTASSRPEGAEPPADVYAEPSFERAPSRPRPSQRRKPPKRRRRRNRRPYVIAGLIVLAFVLAFGVRSLLNSGQDRSYNRIAASAGCGDIRTVGDLSREHTADRVDYETSPPAGGAHAGGTVQAGVYGAALSDDPKITPNVYQAVHSLEHGYVIVWHRDLSEDDLTELERAVRDQREVILAPYPKLPRNEKLGLSAWGRVQTCRNASIPVVNGFIERFRNARTAPEATVP